MGAALRVEVWSDIVCPWCYIGKRRFEQALHELDGEIDVEVAYRPFQLDPRAPVGAPLPVSQVYERKFGGPEAATAIIERVSSAAADEGLDFRLDQALRANTFDAHRLLWHAEHPAAGIDQGQLKERLLRAYFTDGLDVGDGDVLVECAVDVGADRAAVRSFLDSSDGVDEVGTLITQAVDLGITGVPAYVVGGIWTIPGAQDPDVFVQILRRVDERRRAAGGAAAQ